MVLWWGCGEHQRREKSMPSSQPVKPRSFHCWLITSIHTRVVLQKQELKGLWVPRNCLVCFRDFLHVLQQITLPEFASVFLSLTGFLFGIKLAEAVKYVEYAAQAPGGKEGGYFQTYFTGMWNNSYHTNSLISSHWNSAIFLYAVRSEWGHSRFSNFRFLLIIYYTHFC